LGTAIFSAGFSLVVRKGQAHGNAITGVVIGLIVNTPLLIAASWYLWEPEWWNLRAIFWFMAGGVTGPVLGRVFMYQSIHFLGVSRTSPLIASGPLMTAALAYGFLGERPGPFIWGGTVCVVLGCVFITMKGKADSVWDRRFIWLAVAGMMFFSISNLLRKTGINILPVPVYAVTVTYLSALLFMILFSRALPKVHRPYLGRKKAWLFYGVCGLLNTAAFLFHFTAIHFGDLTIVSPISSTSPFFALILSWVFLRDMERITPLLIAGTSFVVLGGVLIVWKII
ncbi:MAG: DMT family transporter, partial [bacterium]|nr:DMT family transporter [bacterium]